MATAADKRREERGSHALEEERIESNTPPIE
jgi:hypothetical protein